MTREELEEFLIGYDENIIPKLEKEGIVLVEDLQENGKVWVIRQVSDNLFQIGSFK